MSDVIARESQKLNQDEPVELYELDLRGFGEGTLRFCAGPLDGGDTVFNGYAYKPSPIKASGFKWDGQGTPPTPTLSLSAMNASLSALIRDSNDILGAPVRRIRTYRRYLDDGISPDPEATMPIEEYLVERKSKKTSTMVEFELSVSFDQEGRKIPGRQVIRDTCTHIYRQWDGGKFSYEEATCPYAGGACFNRNGESVTPENDSCGKKLSDCELRYGNDPLPFYGFPGAGRL